MLVEETSFSLLVGVVLIYLLHIWTRPIPPPRVNAAGAAAAAADAASAPNAVPNVPTPAGTAAAATNNNSAVASRSFNSGGGGNAAVVICALKIMCGADSRDAVRVHILQSAIDTGLTVAQLKSVAFKSVIKTGAKVVLVFFGQRIEDHTRIDQTSFYSVASRAAQAANNLGAGPIDASECILHAFFTNPNVGGSGSGSGGSATAVQLPTAPIVIDAAALRAPAGAGAEAGDQKHASPAAAAAAQPAAARAAGDYYGAGYDAYGYPIEPQPAVRARAVPNVIPDPAAFAAGENAPAAVGAGGGGGGGAVPKPYLTMFAVFLAFLGTLWGLYFAAGPKLFGTPSVFMLSVLTALFIYGARATRVFEAQPIA